MTTGTVLVGILFLMVVMLVGRLSKRAQTRRGHATGSDGSMAMYGDSGGDSGCDSGSGADCGGGDGGGGDGGGGGD